MRGQPEHRPLDGQRPLLRRARRARRARLRPGPAARRRPLVQRYGTGAAADAGPRVRPGRRVHQREGPLRVQDRIRVALHRLLQLAAAAGHLAPRADRHPGRPAVRGQPPTSGRAFTTRWAPITSVASSLAESWPTAFSTGAAAFLAAASLTGPASAGAPCRRGPCGSCRSPAAPGGTSTSPAPAGSPAAPAPTRPGRPDRPGPPLLHGGSLDAERLRQPGHLLGGDLALGAVHRRRAGAVRERAAGPVDDAVGSGSPGAMPGAPLPEGGVWPSRASGGGVPSPDAPGAVPPPGPPDAVVARYARRPRRAARRRPRRRRSPCAAVRRAGRRRWWSPRRPRGAGGLGGTGLGVVVVGSLGVHRIAPSAVMGDSDGTRRGTSGSPAARRRHPDGPHTGAGLSRRSRTSRPAAVPTPAARSPVDERGGDVRRGAPLGGRPVRHHPRAVAPQRRQVPVLLGRGGEWTSRFVMTAP